MSKIKALSPATVESRKETVNVTFSNADNTKHCHVTLVQDMVTNQVELKMNWDPDPKPGDKGELYAGYALHFFRSIGVNL